MLLKTWAFWSVAAPVAMTSICVPLLVGLAVLIGAQPMGIAGDFLTDVAEPLAHVSTHLWVADFFMGVVFYGVSVRSIRQTLGWPLSTPLAVLAARLRKLVFYMTVAQSSMEPTATQQGVISRGPMPDAGTQAPPMALLAGTDPLME